MIYTVCYAVTKKGHLSKHSFSEKRSGRKKQNEKRREGEIF
jgi:hypothetical protein